MAEEDLTKYPESKCVIDFIEERLKKSLMTLILMTGGGGMGKSYSGIRLLQKLYKKWFNEELPVKHICDSLEEAILLVKDFKRKGEGILIEELSVHASVRDSLTTKNKLWNQFLDTARIKGAVIIANMPHLSFVDKHIIMMSQIWINCERVDRKQNIVVCHPLWLQTSPHKKEPYRHRFIDKEGDIIDICYFKKPDDTILKLYDGQKLQAAEEMYDMIALKMRSDRIKKLRELGQKVLPPRELEAYTNYMNGLSAKESTEEMKLSDVQTYYNYLKSAKNKLKRPEYATFLREMGKSTKLVKN